MHHLANTLHLVSLPDAIAASGIPHTFFAPTHLMELLPNLIQGRGLQWIGNNRIKVYWTSVADYARQVVKASQQPDSMQNDVPVQGHPEAIPCLGRWSCSSPITTRR